jgi:hypothetical protein
MSRYPFLSSELFDCELSQILEKFFEAPDLEVAKRVDTEEMDITPEFQDSESLEILELSDGTPVVEDLEEVKPMIIENEEEATITLDQIELKTEGKEMKKENKVEETVEAKVQHEAEAVVVSTQEELA